MKTSSAMLFLLAIILLVESKKKSKVNKRQKNSDNEDDADDFSKTQIEMRGELRRKFSFIATTADPTKSIICSPLSALLPLGKLVLGATGKTESALLSNIGVSNKEAAKEEFINLLKKLRKLQGIHLDIASQVYVNKNVKLKSSYENEVKSVFNTPVEEIDVSDQQATANKVNAWVNRQTHGKIETIISPGDVSASTALIIVNAIYFSGKWKYPFEKVKQGTFYSPRGPITMPMMYVKQWFIYGKSDTLDAQVIKIPYQKEQAFFYIVLPNNKNGLESLLNQLKLVPDLINDAELSKVEVKLTMPKFKIETELDLGLLYKKLGLEDMFYDGLTEMVKGENLKVDKAIHKAMIEVTEEGTEAAAASAVIVGFKLAPLPPIEFTADRPFLYYICSKQEQLFAGSFRGI